MNCHVQPFAIWRRFKFKISLDNGLVRCEKNLAYITIPKTHRFLRGLWCGADNQGFRLLANEADVKGLARPENSGFGMTRGRREITRPVMINLYRLRSIPFSAL